MKKLFIISLLILLLYPLPSYAVNYVKQMSDIVYYQQGEGYFSSLAQDYGMVDFSEINNYMRIQLRWTSPTQTNWYLYEFNELKRSGVVTTLYEYPRNIGGSWGGHNWYIYCTVFPSENYVPQKTITFNIDIDNRVPFQGDLYLEIWCDGEMFVQDFTVSSDLIEQNFSIDITSEDFQGEIEYYWNLDNHDIDSGVTSESWVGGYVVNSDYIRGGFEENLPPFTDPDNPPDAPDAPDGFPDDWEYPTITPPSSPPTGGGVVPPSPSSGGSETPESPIGEGSSPVGDGGMEDITGLTQTEAYEAMYRALIDAGMLYQMGALYSNVGVPSASAGVQEFNDAISDFNDASDSVIEGMTAEIDKGIEKLEMINQLDMPEGIGTKYTFEMDIPILGAVEISLLPYQDILTLIRQLAYFVMLVYFWFAMVGIIKGAA